MIKWLHVSGVSISTDGWRNAPAKMRGLHVPCSQRSATFQVYTEFVYVQKYIVFVICSLLVHVGIDCVTDKLKATFSWMKVLNAENYILGLWNFKIFCGRMRPRTPPPRKRGLMAPCWYSWLLYSNLLTTSIFIEAPDVCSLSVASKA